MIIIRVRATVCPSCDRVELTQIKQQLHVYNIYATYLHRKYVYYILRVSTTVGRCTRKRVAGLMKLYYYYHYYYGHRVE